MVRYYIGQIFVGTYPTDCADWCNSQGNCHIEEIEKKGEKRRFKIVENSTPEPINISLLRMTPLDFINAIEQFGITYEEIKILCDNNPEVDKQLRFCNHVYRGNPLLNQLCGNFGVTSEQLDELFKKYGE